MQDRSLLLRLSLIVLGTGSFLFGLISLIAPKYALGQLGFADVADTVLFEGSLLGAVMVPWGAGLFLAGRQSTSTRIWSSLGIVNSLAALVVLIFFLGKGTVELGRVWPLVIVYGIGLFGISIFGQRELRGVGVVRMIDPDRDSETAQSSYRVDVESGPDDIGY